MDWFAALQVLYLRQWPLPDSTTHTRKVTAQNAAIENRPGEARFGKVPLEWGVKFNSTVLVSNQLLEKELIKLMIISQNVALQFLLQALMHLTRNGSGKGTEGK